MGSICTKPQAEPAVQRKSGWPLKISTNIYDSQAERIDEIKQFLTLTPKDTPSFYSRQEGAKSISDLKLVRGLGRGTFGQVFLVKDSQQGQFYAMKIIHKESILLNERPPQTILEEIDHPCIAKMHFAFHSARKLYLVTELLPGGELFYLLRRIKQFPEEVGKFYAAQVLLALEHLHARGITYRDLKPENILLEQSGLIKITDFGLSRACNFNRQISYSLCAPEYIAPEVLLGGDFSPAADWFSLGALIYDMLTGKPPFYSPNKSEMVKRILTQPPPFPEDLSPQAKSLLSGLLMKNPKERLGFERDANEIKAHPFFAHVGMEEILRREVPPPVSFRRALQEEGQDVDFANNNSLGSTFNVEETHRLKGVVLDRFTYYLPEIWARRRESEEMGEYSGD